jgi:hypothetical protein
MRRTRNPAAHAANADLRRDMYSFFLLRALRKCVGRALWGNVLFLPLGRFSSNSPNYSHLDTASFSETVLTPSNSLTTYIPIGKFDAILFIAFWAGFRSLTLSV